MSEAAVVTLTDFLLARIDDEEGLIRGAQSCGGLVPFSSAHLLAECEARRRIVEFGLSFDEMFYESDDLFDARAAITGSASVVVVLRHLAVVYADHPDYRDEWRPGGGA